MRYRKANIAGRSESIIRVRNLRKMEMNANGRKDPVRAAVEKAGTQTGAADETGDLPITVLLADDHGLVRKGFRLILEDDPAIRVVGEAADGLEAVKLALALCPRVIVMDLSMPRLNGLLTTSKILRARPATAILMVSMYSEEHYVRAAMTAGARGYVLKNALDVDLADAVKRAAAGQRVITPGLADLPYERDEDAGRLSPREKHVLQLIAEGKTNREMAALLGISVNTVNVHRANIMETLRIHRTVELVLYAVRKGLVHLP